MVVKRRVGGEFARAAQGSSNSTYRPAARSASTSASHSTTALLLSRRRPSRVIDTSSAVDGAAARHASQKFVAREWEIYAGFAVCGDLLQSDCHRLGLVDAVPLGEPVEHARAGVLTDGVDLVLGQAGAFRFRPNDVGRRVVGFGRRHRSPSARSKAFHSSSVRPSTAMSASVGKGTARSNASVGVTTVRGLLSPALSATDTPSRVGPRDTRRAVDGPAVSRALAGDGVRNWVHGRGPPRSH